MNRTVYLPVNDAQNVWGVALTAAGHGRVRPGEHYPLTGHPKDHEFNWERGRILDALQLVYITDGEGEFENRKGTTHHVSSGSVFLVLPSVWHRYRPDHRVGWTEDWLELRGTTIRRLLKQKVLAFEDPILRIGLRSDFLDIFRRVLELAADRPTGFESILATMGLQTLALLKSYAARADEQTGTLAAAISRSQTMIAEQAHQLLSTADIAAEVAMSESYFRKAFKKRTGFTPKQYHMELRLRLAQTALTTTSLTVKEIAAKLSFHSAFHFSAFFKDKTGKSPLAWRRARQRLG